MSADVEMLFVPRVLDNGPAPHDKAEWTRHENGLISLAKYSAALEVADTRTTLQELRSIPTPWARLLIFEQALYNHQHPSRADLVPEWRGLLGVIGLAEYLSLEVDATRVLLPSNGKTAEAATSRASLRPAALPGRAGAPPARVSGDSVMGVLRAMAPVGDHPEVWDYHGLITVNGKLVGGTSSRTLVFTGVRAAPDSVPFRRDGRLTDPALYYTGPEGREPLSVLSKWISDTIGALEGRRSALEAYMGRQPASASTNPVWRSDLLLAELRAWQADVGAVLDELGGPLVQPAGIPGRSPFVGIFPEEHPGAVVLGELRPITYESQDQRNDLAFADGRFSVDPGTQGLILKDGKPYTGYIKLPRGRTLRVEGGRPLSRQALHDAGAVDFTRLFEPTLVPVLDVKDEYATLLRCDDARFLLPFADDILQYLDEATVAGVTARRDKGVVTVQLNVPLANGFSVRYDVGFPAQAVIAEHSTPTLAVWPDFRSPHWHRYYYVMQQIARSGSLTLEPLGTETVARHADEDSATTWGELPSYPSAWRARANGSGAGLLFTRRPEQAPTLRSGWSVSVDFGSTNTRVFRAEKDEHGEVRAEPVRLEPRAVPVLGSPGTLAANFFSPVDAGSGDRRDEPPSTLRFPLGRWMAPVDRERWLPADGVMFWPTLLGSGKVPGLKADLKWHENEAEDLPAFKSYITQLYLCIAAEAAAQGASITTLRTAYPSIFPQHQRAGHFRLWSTLASADGVQVLEPVSESRAVATYLQRERDGTIGDNTLSIDVGGSTTDLAVWKNVLLAGDSVWLAGDILSRLVASSADARRIVSEAAGRDPIRQADKLKWDPNGGALNRLIFNSLLRHIRQTHGSTRVLAQNMDTGKGGGGDWFISHAAYLYATVSFVMGMMARRVNLRTPRYDLRFVGHGAEFLEWLEVLHPGTSQSLPRAFFLAGLGMPAAPVADRKEGNAPALGLPEVSVQLPGADVKQEVGRGLLGKLVGEAAEPERERSTFFGESFAADPGLDVAWNTPLTLDVLQQLPAPEQPPESQGFSALNAFVEAFGSDFGAALAARTLALREAWKQDNGLRAWIHNSLFGPDSAWAASQEIRKADERRRGAPAEPDPGIRLEPFFVLEAKALLEHVTANTRLFRSR